MTVVAWDGVRLAADKRISLGGLHATTTKVHRLADGRLFAGCGIVAGSRPEAELAETAAKLVPMRDALQA